MAQPLQIGSIWLNLATYLVVPEELLPLLAPAEEEQQRSNDQKTAGLCRRGATETQQPEEQQQPSQHSDAGRYKQAKKTRF